MYAANTFLLECAVLFVGVILLLLDLFGIKKEKIPYIGSSFLLIIFLASFVSPIMFHHSFSISSMLIEDNISVFFIRFVLLVSSAILLMIPTYFPNLEHNMRGTQFINEFSFLPVFASLGLMLMISSVDLIMLFVALELATITFYVLVSFFKKNLLSLEAGIKFLILGSLSTGILVYGITWFFGMTGTTNLVLFEKASHLFPHQTYIGLSFALSLILTAIGFKIAAFPFQFWIPDVYQGAPTPVTALLSIASKAAGFVFLIRILVSSRSLVIINQKLEIAILCLAILTLIFGNLVAISQTNFKRLLAYSSIAHAGYILMAIASLDSKLALPAIGFYFISYALASLLAFFVLMIIENVTCNQELYSFNGLYHVSPFLACCLLIAVSSLAGIPFTGGFLGKLLVFEVALKQGHYGLVVIACMAVAIGFYFYFKVIRNIFFFDLNEKLRNISLSLFQRVFLSILMISIIMIVFIPNKFLMALH